MHLKKGRASTHKIMNPEDQVDNVYQQDILLKRLYQLIQSIGIEARIGKQIYYDVILCGSEAIKIYTIYVHFLGHEYKYKIYSSQYFTDR